MSDLLDRLRLHKDDSFGFSWYGRCVECNDPWPCDTARAVERIAELEAKSEADNETYDSAITVIVGLWERIAELEAAKKGQ